MKIQVNRNGLVVVDGQVRQVNVADLNPEVEVVYFDTDRGKGVVQYLDTVLVEVEERDFDAERAAEAYAKENNLRPPEEPIYKTVQVPKPDRQFTNWNLVELWYERWVAAEPPPPQEPPPPDPRIVEIEDSYRQGSIGNIQPATVAELKAMTRDEYLDWFNANFTNAAQALALLRRLTLLIIRRLL